MNKLTVFTVSAVALFASLTAQADPVLEYELTKDHNFYHVVLDWYDVNSDFATLYLNGNEWVTYPTYYGHTSFYTTRTRRNQPKTFFVCEAETDTCSDPVTLNFKNSGKPINGGGKNN